MNYEMQRRDKWMLSQLLPSVPQDLSACWLQTEGCTAQTGQGGKKPPLCPAEKEICVSDSSTSEGW